MANLVQNALRFAPAGTPVRVLARKVDAGIELRVIDRGPGFPPEAATQVFAAFQRRDDATASGAGLGLGLAIARGFTEAMGGTVRAEATPGGGRSSSSNCRWSRRTAPRCDGERGIVGAEAA